MMGFTDSNTLCDSETESIICTTEEPRHSVVAISWKFVCVCVLAVFLPQHIQHPMCALTDKEESCSAYLWKCPPEHMLIAGWCKTKAGLWCCKRSEEWRLNETFLNVNEHDLWLTERDQHTLKLNLKQILMSVLFNGWCPTWKVLLLIWVVRP